MLLTSDDTATIRSFRPAVFPVSYGAAVVDLATDASADLVTFAVRGLRESGTVSFVIRADQRRCWPQLVAAVAEVNPFPVAASTRTMDATSGLRWAHLTDARRSTQIPVHVRTARAARARHTARVATSRPPGVPGIDAPGVTPYGWWVPAHTGTALHQPACAADLLTRFDTAEPGHLVTSPAHCKSGAGYVDTAMRIPVETTGRDGIGIGDPDAEPPTGTDLLLAWSAAAAAFVRLEHALDSDVNPEAARLRTWVDRLADTYVGLLSVPHPAERLYLDHAELAGPLAADYDVLTWAGWQGITRCCQRCRNQRVGRRAGGTKSTRPMRGPAR